MPEVSARWWRQLWACALALACLLAWAPSRANDAAEVSLDRNGEGLFLSVRQPLDLSPVVEEVLYKAVPIFFTHQVDVMEPRWYWTDKRVTSATRTLRLAYQPLTRRWRLSVASGQAASNGNAPYALHLNFDSLSEAVAAIGRVARWKVAEATVLDADERYRVEYRFRLDLSLLPRPFQIGVANQPEWTIERQQRLEAGALSP